MTAMSTMIPNNLIWTNVSSDESIDYNDLFSSFDLIDPDNYDQQIISNTQSILSSPSHLGELQVSSTDMSETECFQSNLICGVCGAPANGYNFDQITCESCKAFFRRNALRNMADLKCRFARACVINIQTRRQCTYCRLKKCFDIKMRKEWIRTEEETKLRQLQKLIKEERKYNRVKRDLQPILNLPIVVRKKKRLMLKQVVPVVNPIFNGKYFGFNRNLCAEDHDLLNNITNAYQLSAAPGDAFRFNKYTRSTPFWEFIDGESTIHTSLIEFYKRIPEFKQIDIDDQVLLIKSNLINIIHIHDIFIQNFNENPITGILMSNWISEDFHNQMSRTRRHLYRFVEYPIILKLALIVFLFSIHRWEDYNNKIAVQKTYDIYTTLLWRYLNYLFEEREAIKSMEILTAQILHFQILMTMMEKKVRAAETQNKVSHGLMQSVFRLT